MIVINIVLLSPNNQKLKKLHKKYKGGIEEDFFTSSSIEIDKSIEELASLKFKKDTSPHNGASIAFILVY